MKKICILSSVHPAQDVRVFCKEAKALMEVGYEITIIAQHLKDEIIEGIRIISAPKSSNRLERMTLSQLKIIKLAVREKADLYHFHDPELILGCILLKIFLGKKIIYDVHEDVPRQILGKHWISPCLRKVVSKGIALIEGLGANYFDRIIVATPLIAKRFPKKKTKIVQNFPILDEFSKEGSKPYEQRDNYIAYIGGISEIRGASEMVKAIKLLPNSLNIRLKLAGNYNEGNFEDKLRNYPGWRFVDYLGWQSRSGINKLLQEVKVGLVVLQPQENYLEAYPVKLFEYMAAGIPAIASDFPLWKTIVEGNNCGICVNPSDPVAIAKAIQWMIENPEGAKRMGENGRKAVETKYNWENAKKQLLTIYRQVDNMGFAEKIM